VTQVGIVSCGRFQVDSYVFFVSYSGCLRIVIEFLNYDGLLNCRSIAFQSCCVAGLVCTL
jgi:hypothetical protein